MIILHGLLGLLILASCTPLNGMDWLKGMVGLAPEKIRLANFLHPNDLQIKLQHIHNQSLYKQLDGSTWDIKPSKNWILIKFNERIKCTINNEETYDLEIDIRGSVSYYKGTYTDARGTTYTIDQITDPYSHWYKCTTHKKTVVYTAKGKEFKGSQPPYRGYTVKGLIEEARETKKAKELVEALQRSELEQEEKKKAAEILNSQDDLPPAYDVAVGAASQQQQQQSPGSYEIYTPPSPLQPTPPSLDSNSVILGAILVTGIAFIFYYVKQGLAKSKPLT